MPELPAVGITPDSRLADVLERWPGMEEVLVEVSPHFRALRNPVLRRTVAKVATIRQAATVSGVPLGALIARLRASAGLEPLAVEDGPPSQGERPAWANKGAVTRSLDVRAAVEAGEHPVARVMGDLSLLAGGQVYELVTAFVPAPLVDMTRQRGFRAFSAVEPDGTVTTYFRRTESDLPATS
ncbi:MAG TPA: DUF1858 domain-containing protein [Anaeromyxobacteraceae bacterium]|nr:DUF1858 domain-containing protein [Anaeromyxobacteraceae bacterium]